MSGRSVLHRLGIARAITFRERVTPYGRFRISSQYRIQNMRNSPADRSAGFRWSGERADARNIFRELMHGLGPDDILIVRCDPQKVTWVAPTLFGERPCE